MSNTTRGADLRRLRREMLAVDDARLRQIVRFVDDLPVRGEADQLIAPLRPRLALLRPPRPLSLARLLFLPLEPLIVEARGWRAGDLGIPRSVLLPLAAVVAAAVGALAREAEALIAGRLTSEAEVVAAAGAKLWPAAALALADCQPPPDWAEATGLRAAGFAPIARPIAALLAHGPALYALALAGGDPADALAAPHLLDAAAQDGAEALAMMLAVLLARLHNTGELLLLAEDLARRAPEAARGAPDRALDFLLAGLDGSTTAADEAALGVDALRRASMLMEGIEGQPIQRPSRAAKLKWVRRRLDAICRGRVEAAVASLGRAGPAEPSSSSSSSSAAAAAAAAPAAPASDSEVNTIEAAALELRRLEAVGRRLGAPDFYDTALRRTAQGIAAAADLTPVDRLRLAEILLGPDAALDLMARAPAPGGR